MSNNQSGTDMAKLYNFEINQTYKWHAIYSRINHVKTVENELLEKNIEVYLPKKRVLHQWSDRKRWVEKPLFRPYLFVHVSNKEYHKVLETPSVCSYICFSGRAATIPDEQISLLKIMIQQQYDFEIIPNRLHSHQKIKITEGPLKGFFGEVVVNKNRNKIQVIIEPFKCAIHFEIDAQSISPL
ncbi:MAG TPA: UpxY family transcription antiterminator [Bacteroidales bacterium]|nr:UpxY family transcription antiterminator [Bacteroidales bacterium]